MTKDSDHLHYPIGKFSAPENIDEAQIEQWIRSIEQFPKRLAQEVNALSQAELEKTYRPGGWSIRQIVHHCADSHMNSFIRFKLALTEDEPTIKAYYEALWAELPDANTFPVDSSLKILEGLHQRWTNLLWHLSTKDLKKQFGHPETDELIPLSRNIGLYAWHGEHHLQHIKNAKKQ